MAFEDLRERLADQGKVLWSRIQDSSAYAQFKERYDALPPKGQKAVVAGTVVFAFLILFLLFPYSYYSAGNDSIDQFVYNRDLTRELFRVEREVSQIQMPSALLDAGSLESQLNSLNSIQKIQDSQRQGVQDFQLAPEQKKKIPSRIQAAYKSVRFSQLNIQQITDLASTIERLDPNLRLWSVSILPSSKASYFDVDYRVALFSLPQRGSSEIEKPNKKSRRFKDVE